MAVAFAMAFLADSALAQSTTQGTSGGTSSPVRPGYSDPGPSTSLDLLRDDDPRSRETRMNARRDEIKKRMSQSAQRLLLLTAELRADLQTREPTEADSKRLEDIARLAHAVREQMRQ